MSQRNSLRWELAQALKQKTCPICWVSQKSVQRFLDGLLYENVNDPDIRRHVTAALGFCHRHAWQMRTVNGGSLGMALLHRDALQQWQNPIDQVSKPGGRTENDYRFVSEGFGAEGDAWIRAMERLSGAEGALSIIPERETKNG
jgi:hypothetical protein